MTKKAIVIGAGMGGLAAAIELSCAGFDTELYEANSKPGGRMREDLLDNQRIDAGPTVLTMLGVFEELFALAGRNFSDHVTLHPLDVLARHHWLDGSNLDLFTDVGRSHDAISVFAGTSEAKNYLSFAAETARMHRTLNKTFMQREKPGMLGLSFRVGIHRTHDLLATRPFTTYWRHLTRKFKDPRLRQLFARYATYCGSSPLQAPATLGLIAHVEQNGVWAIRNGMQRLAEALAECARSCGVQLHFDSAVESILTRNQTTAGVRLASGEERRADLIIFNGEAGALNAGLVGRQVQGAIKSRLNEKRSLSAMTWSMVNKVSDFDLAYHTVLFQDNYEDEFASIFDRGELPPAPTLYVCAQDRLDEHSNAESERLFVLANAPPRSLSSSDIDAYERRVFELASRHGLTLQPTSVRRRTPNDFAERFAGSQGAIYGWPVHGAMGSFRRQGATTNIKGLYLAGGSVHPGPGIPMATLSGRIAARSAIMRHQG